IYAIKPVGTIERPRETVSARYLLNGIDLDMIIKASDRQQLVGSDSNIIEVTTEPRNDAVIDDEFEQYLNDAPFIESRNNLIQETASRIVTGKSNRLDSLNALSEWVFRNIEKRPSAGIPSALAVLNTRQGDCNEHSVLFTALARSLGIPTRIQLGVVYQDGRFYYHAWTASLVDGRWLEFDPTFGLIRADAARIALVSGDMRDAQQLAGVVGRIEIEIIESER
ncbi:MAG: transglutaminase-like domain-containing protein, partial [Candidatus Electryoneaceae bacterium]|nr:transglutaminase-like domain-containing protein [Candidatus Electryoneaceae bacterium]